jgi:hypothetical protein
MSKANTKAILADIKSYLETNDKIVKKDFLKAVGEAFDKNKGAKPKALKLKAKAKEEVEGESNIEAVMNKKDNLIPDEDKPKRKLSDYQQFAKEQLAFLKQREDAKEEGEEKLKQKDLMKLVAKRWKLKKEGIDETEWDDRIAEDDE